jgi:phosphate transport system protein
VIDRDDEIDRFDNFIDDLCLRLLRSDQTKETDLRFVTMAMKIVTDLERMGDNAVNVAKRAISLNETPQVKPIVLPRMADGAVDGEGCYGCVFQSQCSVSPFRVGKR